MIKYNIDDKERVLNLEVKGDVAALASDVILLMSEIYNDMKAEHPDGAKDFKNCIILAIEEGVVFASEEERKSIIKKRYEEVAVQLAKKAIDSFFDSIRGWKDDADTDSD